MLLNILKNVFKYSKIFKNIHEHLETFMNIQKGFETLANWGTNTEYKSLLYHPPQSWTVQRIEEGDRAGICMFVPQFANVFESFLNVF